MDDKKKRLLETLENNTKEIFFARSSITDLDEEWFITEYMKSDYRKKCSELDPYYCLGGTGRALSFIIPNGDYKKSNKSLDKNFLIWSAVLYNYLAIRFPKHNGLLVDYFSVEFMQEYYRKTYKRNVNESKAVLINLFNEYLESIDEQAMTVTNNQQTVTLGKQHVVGSKKHRTLYPKHKSTSAVESFVVAINGIPNKSVLLEAFMNCGIEVEQLESVTKELKKLNESHG